jgi:hypothetical protein
MRVARPFKNIQLFLFNSLRAVGWGMKLVLHAMDLINPVLAAVSRKSSTRVRIRVVRVRSKVIGEGFMFRV